MHEPNDASSPPVASAEGLLSERPVAHLLLYALHRGLSGTFELADDPKRYALIVVSQGQILRVWTSDPVSYLGHVLYENAVVTDVQLQMSLAEIATTKQLHGQLLLAKQIITSAQLSTALRQQRLRKLHHTFSFPPTTRFAFYSGHDFVGARPGDVDPVDPLPAIWRGITENASLGHVRAAIKAVGTRAIRVTGAIDAPFQPHERAAVELLRERPATVAQLTARPGFDARTAALLVYFLAIAKRIELIEVPAQTDPAVYDEGPPSSVDGPPSSLRIPPASLREAGYSRGTPPVPVRSPSTPSGPPRAPISIPASPPSSPAGAGLRPSLIGRPPGSVRRPSVAPASAPQPASAPRPPRNPTAERALARAEMHFVLGELEEASAHVTEAVTLAPKMQAAIVLLTALEASRLGEGEEPKLRELIKRIDSVLAIDPGCRRGGYYRARLKEQLGDLHGALADLLQAVELDPDDVFVERELSLVKRKL